MHILISILYRFTARLVSRSDGSGAVSDDVGSGVSSALFFRMSGSWFLKHQFALMVVVVFFLAGFWVLDDYGVGTDTGAQRGIAVQNLEYLVGRSDLVFSDFHRFYGITFELPLLLLERVLGLEDTRDIHLMRHMLTHLFFLTGGFFCYLLAYRLFGNRLLALVAMLLFLLHPRIYAHSFFNSKDVPFLSMFMVCLYLIHRAFDRYNAWWFVILGIGVAILINLRIIGITLFMIVFGMQVLDLFRASDRGEVRRILNLIAVFMISGLVMLYVVSPHLWGDPVVGFVEWFAAFSQHPSPIYQLFRGDLILSIDVNPPEYIPVWMSISTPPVVLVLCVLGILVVLMHGAFNPRAVLHNTRLRFGLLLIVCICLPLLSVIILDVNVYYGWRQMYFLHASFCLLSIFGLHWLISVTHGMRLSLFLYGAFGAVVVVVVASMISIHPHQHLYFNFLVDRTTPEHVRSQYDMDYWTTVFREGFEHLLELFPFSTIHLQISLASAGHLNWEVLADKDRGRLILERETSDFYITNYQSFKPLESPRSEGTSPLVYSRVIYGSRVLGVGAVNLSLVDDSVVSRYRGIYQSAMSLKLVAHSEWDLYVDNSVLIYVKESCASIDSLPGFFLHLSLDDIDALPEYRRRGGHKTRIFDFDFGKYGVRFDGKCMVVVPIQYDGVSGVRTGQFTSDGELWSVAINIRSGGEDSYRAEYESVSGNAPAISSEFDIYLSDGRLIYVREPCDVSDVEAEFFLHVVPLSVDDLPPPRRETGFDNLDFVFDTRGLMFDGMCIASAGLPDYEIERIRTGQWDSDQQRNVWKEEFDVVE